ncbi:MAG: hypothetical protein M3R61_14615 [Chloroflexota bacterium]|nr:hypothetical protein [Chloroflexota bacterium]
MYDNRPAKNIQLVSVEVENTGARAVKNQAFTVIFDEKSYILGSPKILTPGEDLKFVRMERVPDLNNSYHFAMKVLQKGRKLGWSFTLLDNASGIFKIQPGLATTGDSIDDVDLDVDVIAIAFRIKSPLS